MSKQILGNLYKIHKFSAVKRSFTSSKIPTESSSGAESNPPGLSQACLKVSSQPVGPGAAKNTDYKNPEYFCYHTFSYFEAEVEMLKFRCPQPCTDKPYFQNK